MPTDTVHDRLAQRAAIAPGDVALETHQRAPLTHGALRDLIASTVDVLGRAGVGRGDVVAIVLPHGPELATACLAVMAAATAAPLNPEYREAELAALFESLDPACAIVPAARASVARDVALARGIPLIEFAALDGPAGSFRLDAAPATQGARERGFTQAADVALLLHTSGTTARPKKVPLTQRNLVASIDHLVSSLALTAADRCLHLLPLYHIGGIVDVLAAPLAAGGRVACTSPFSVPEFHRGLEAFRPTWTQCAPAMLQELVLTAGEHAAAIARHRMRFLRSVSAALPADLLERVESNFGAPVIEIYGMTETAGVITSNPLPPRPRKPGSVGVAAGPEVAIVDAGGAHLPAGSRGEVVVRGDNVMAGYAGGDDANALAWFGPWLRTGDEGSLDGDGYLFLTGRIKEIVNRGGEKVSPFEVDDALRAHPAVLEAATFAVPHPTLGEEVAAAVVLRPGASAEPQALVDHLRGRLAWFKVPRVLRVVPAIPKTAGGKLRRRDLPALLGIALDDAGDARAPYVAPSTPAARTLSRLWEETLGVERIGIDDDFFALGGDSLKAASFVNRIEADYGDVVYVTSLFDAPTLARYEAFLRDQHPELAARLAGERAPGARSDRPAVDDALLANFRASIVPPPRRRPATADRLAPAVFVLSTPRSGSTLFRAMLAGHPRLFAPPELYLLSFDDLADRRDGFAGTLRFQLEGNLRALMQLHGLTAEGAAARMAELESARTPVAEYYRQLQAALDGRLLVDKTPYYATYLETLERAEAIFRDARYIHLVRHPCGMIRSFDEAKLGQLWYPRLVGVAAAERTPCPWPSLAFAEMLWTVLQENMLRFLARVPAERQVRIAFEDVVRAPEPTMRSLGDFLGVGYDPAMLEPQRNRGARMTDGIHPESRMIGDMKFHGHASIDPAVADRWRDAIPESALARSTVAVARALGYAIADPAERTGFTL